MDMIVLAISELSAQGETSSKQQPFDAITLQRYTSFHRYHAMTELSKRSTVYFESDIHHALRIKAATTHQSVSEVVNEAVRLSLQEDQEDLSAFEQRAGEATISYEELLDDLKSHGKL